MKKPLLIIAAIILFSITAHSQITKGNWMVGGSGSFEPVRSSVETTISLNPGIGYFIVDKLAVGINAWVMFNTANKDDRIVTFDIGHFARYYFLSTAKKFNLFAQADYSYASTSAGCISFNSGNNFQFSVGGVMFFNSSVGLEILPNYTIQNSSTPTNKVFKIDIGFQIHLETEKNYNKHH